MIYKNNIMVHPEILTDKAEQVNQQFNITTFEKGLIKTGIIRCTNTNITEKELTHNWVEQFCAAAEDLKKNHHCQFIVAYIHTDMPDSTKITNKDFWVAQLHTIDLLFVKEDKNKRFSRICQGKNKQEIILSPLCNQQKEFGSITIHFDMESKKKMIGIH
jgi:hypothetical protein